MWGSDAARLVASGWRDGGAERHEALPSHRVSTQSADICVARYLLSLFFKSQDVEVDMAAAMKLVLFGVVGGLALGVGGGLLFAPGPGEALRRRIARLRLRKATPTPPDPGWSDGWADAAEPEISTLEASIPPSASDFGELPKPVDVAS